MDYFVADHDQQLAAQQIHMLGIVYHNISDRYAMSQFKARQGSVCVFDYQELNQGGDFLLDSVSGEIREYFSNGSYEVVATTGI